MSKHTPWSLNDYLSSFRDADGLGFPEGEKGYRSVYPISKRITCADGFSFSAQANHGAYCSPRENTGPWYEVEVGFPNAEPELIMEYVEDESRPTETVYAYVPVELVEKLIDLHGGPDEQTRAAIAKATGEHS